MSLKERAAATMAAGYRVYRVDSAILPSTAGGGARGGGARGAGGRRGDNAEAARRRRKRRPAAPSIRARASALIAEAAEQIRDGVGPDGNWMIDLHQKFDFHEAVEVCNLIAPTRPFCVEDPAARRTVPHADSETAADDHGSARPRARSGVRERSSARWSSNRDIDFARASLPNVGGITEMLKIMALCDTHKVGIVPHFTGPIATAGHMHTMMAFPGQVLMEYNQADAPCPICPTSSNAETGKCGRTTGRDSA